MPLMDLSAFNLDCRPQEIVDGRFLETHGVLPLFQRGSKVFLADDDADHGNDIHDQHVQVVLHTCNLGNRPLQVQAPFSLHASGRRPQHKCTDEAPSVKTSTSRLTPAKSRYL